MTLSKQLLDFEFSEKTVRPKALIVSLMGEVVYPLGGVIWASDLVKVCNWFGVSQFSARIGIARLFDEGWLQKVKVAGSKRSFYRFSEYGERTFLDHQHVIYQQPDQWTPEQWVVLINKNPDSEQLNKLFLKLRWCGFGRYKKDIYLSPRANLKKLEALLQFWELSDGFLIFQSHSTVLPHDLFQKIANEIWQCDEVIEDLRQFHFRLKSFEELGLVHQNLETMNALYLRLKLIHCYRSLVLRAMRVPLQHKNLDAEFHQLFQRLGTLYHQLLQCCPQEKITQLLYLPHTHEANYKELSSRFNDGESRNLPMNLMQTNQIKIYS